MYLVLADTEILSIIFVAFRKAPKLIALILTKMLIAQSPAIMQRPAIKQTSDTSRDCFVGFADEKSIEAPTDQANNDNENTLFDNNGISLNEESFCKTNYIHHLSSISAKTNQNSDLL